jgi:hypothetical protein
MQNAIAKSQLSNPLSLLENRNDRVMLLLQAGLLFSGIYAVQYYQDTMSLVCTALLGSATGMICAIWVHRFSK